MSGHTALILGAGASLNYGLPLGSQLVEKICQLLPSSHHNTISNDSQLLHNFLANDTESVLAWKKINKKDLSHALIEFRQRLVESAPKSIDEFLSRDFGDANPLYRRIGKLSIAQVIASCESVSAIQSGGAENYRDHWYRYLWQDCLNTGDMNLEALRAKKLRIISFNYDRSLEYFLGRSIAATYLTKAGESLDPATANQWAAPGFKEIEENFHITHPYGTLGSLTKIEYGSKNNFQYFGGETANNIHVIGEERNKVDSFELAKEWISSAQRVVFLGFSFDPTNMARLGLESGLSPSYLSEAGHVIREVSPMTFGFAQAERSRLVGRYFKEFNWHLSSFSNMNQLPVSEPTFTPLITSYLRNFGCLSDI